MCNYYCACGACIVWRTRASRHSRHKTGSIEECAQDLVLEKANREDYIVINYSEREREKERGRVRERERENERERERDR